jgi:hypothetical protein
VGKLPYLICVVGQLGKDLKGPCRAKLQAFLLESWLVLHKQITPVNEWWEGDSVMTVKESPEEKRSDSECELECVERAQQVH